MATSFASAFRPSSRRARLWIIFLAGMLVSAGIVTVAVALLLNPFSQYKLRTGIEDYAQGVAEHVAFDSTGMPIGLDGGKVAGWVFTGLGKELALRVLDQNGRVAYSNEANALPLTRDDGVFSAQPGAFLFVRDGVAMHAATVPIENHGKRWYVQFAASDRFVLQMHRSVGFTSLTQGLVATCVLFLVIFVITTHLTLRMALKPLRTASDAASSITPRSLDMRLDAEAQP